VIPLRPLGVGEILDGAISTIRSRPRIMLGLSAVIAVAAQLVTVPITWLLLRDAGDISFSSTSSTSSSSTDDFSLTASSLGASLVQFLVTLVATLLLTGILTVVLSKAVLGQTVETGEAWAQARPRLLPLLGVTALVGLIGLGVFTVCLAPGIVLLITDAPIVATVLAFVAGVPAAVCLAVYLYTAFALAPASVVLERQGVIAALRRSRRLVRGAWWRTFAILLLVNVIAQILASILSVPFMVLSWAVAYFAGDGNDLNPYELLPLLITAVGTIVASAITWPFTAVSTALVYVDRRIRREALDLELTRAAGLTPVGQAATPGTPLDPGPPPPPYGA
jgi:hypothetical protein